MISKNWDELHTLLKSTTQEERQKEINKILREAKLRLQEATTLWGILSYLMEDYDGRAVEIDKKVERGDSISKQELFSYRIANLDKEDASKICGKLQKASDICRLHFSQDKFNP